MVYDPDLGFDPDSLQSIAGWSRRERFKSRSYDEEPTPTPAPKATPPETDAEAARRLDQIEADIAWIGAELEDLARAAGQALREVESKHDQEVHRLTDELQLLQRRLLQHEQREKRVTIIAPSADLKETLDRGIGALRTEIESLRQQVREQQHKDGHGRILDLPALPRRAS
jgi:hypothetical protein